MRIYGLLALSAVVAAPLLASAATPLDLAPDDLVVEGDPGVFEQELTAETIEDGLNVFTLTLTADEPTVVKPFKLKFSFPSADVNAYWHSGQQIDRVTYFRTRFTAESTGRAPVLCFYNSRQQNRVTIAASETRHRVGFSCVLREEDLRFYPAMAFAAAPAPPTTRYRVRVRVDTRPIAYHRALDGVRRWWQSSPGYERAPTPDGAKQAVYSTWYSYHQNLDPDRIVAECERAAALGCGVVIIDDGWQTLDSSRGYRFTGDWEPERIPDLRGMIDRIHATGMKAVLWYAPPLIGLEAKRFEAFDGKYLSVRSGMGAGVLDPRYPEVRAMMIDTYETALRRWDLDGFKFDFIGTYKVRDPQLVELTAEGGRDFASVDDAVDHLMAQITGRLRAIKPDVLIEFRQPYVGPEMQKFGNMFRGTDCANNAAVNRAETVNLRLLCGSGAVHSDMVAWRQEEPAHSAALQILNVLFSVPQISVRLGEQPPEHTQMLRRWLGYWNDNRALLLDGEFLPGSPAANFPSVTAVKDGKQVTALYETPVARQQADGLHTLDVVNASGEEVVYLDLSEGWGAARLRVFDVLGNLVAEKTSPTPQGVHRIEAPLSGLVRIERAD